MGKGRKRHFTEKCENQYAGKMLNCIDVFKFALELK